MPFGIVECFEVIQIKKQHCAMLAFARLEPGQCDETRTEFGAAEEGERTKLEWIPVCELGNMIFQDLKTFALVQWFLRMRREGDARCRP